MRVIEHPDPGSAELDEVRVALERGELVVVPTDTVYGIAALATDEAAVRRLYELKQRPLDQATAVIFPTVAALREQLPWLGVRANWAVQSLLPGPWTLIVANPDGHFPWLTGGRAAPLGVRVPAGALELPPIAATSANTSGQPTAETVQELEETLTAQLSVAVDHGVLPRAAESTVLDLAAWEDGGEVRVLRDTAGRAGQALAVLASVP